jgi:hypothetical protein
MGIVVRIFEIDLFGQSDSVTVSGSILQLADDDSTSTLNLEKKRRDDRLWWLASMLIFAGALV